VRPRPPSPARDADAPVRRLKLKGLHRFTSTATAVEDISALQEGKLPKGLKKFLAAEIVDKGKGKETLSVVDKSLGARCSSSSARGP
jgi:nucleolar protein 58